MQWFNRYSIKSRLIASFLVLFALLATVVGVAWLNNARSQVAVKGIVEQDMVKLELVAEIDSMTKANARNTLELFVIEPSARPAVQARMGTLRKQLDELFQRLEPMLQSNEGRALFVEMRTRRLAYVAAFTAAADMLESDAAAANQLLTQKVLPAIDALAQPITQLKALQLKISNASGSRLEAQMQRQNQINLAIGAVAVILVVVLAGSLVRAIMQPLEHAMKVAATVAQGDLTLPIRTDGDHEFTRLLESLKAMQSHLSATLMRVQENTTEVASASSQIAAANLDLSARTEAQASSLEQTAASMEQITASVQSNQQMTQTANQLSATAAKHAKDVGERVQEVVGMIRDLHESSQRIRDITSVIDGIAFQTNILALNAAVEAARAGEQGRGFAVVAAEVRSLAKRSAEAAQEIKTIIQTNTEKMDAGTELAEKAGTAVQEVVTSIERVNATAADVAVASREQSDGIDQISQAVMQLDQATQQNAALVEETSAATSNLDDQVQSLKQQISRFRLA